MKSTQTKTVAVGVAGLGRSGWDIHCALLAPMTDKYRIAAVFDGQAPRRDEAMARFGCRAYDSYDALLADGEVELVIVAMPSHLHAEYSIRALEAGKAVVCEKPMATNLADADRMLAAARKSGHLLTVFQNRRYDPVFLKVKEVIASGKLGRIVEIKMTSHHFARRWDWQTLQKYGGGTLRNTGPHLLDQALDLIGEREPQVFCRMECVLTSGDAEDHVKLILAVPNGPLVDLEITSACAYPQEHWLVMGSQGTLAGSDKSLRWKYFDPRDLPPRPVDERPTPDRSYNRETIPWKEETWESPTGSRWGQFYDDLYQTLHTGAPLVVRPETVRRQMAIIEECFRQSRPPVRFR